MVEGTCLENKQGESSRGFKSYFLRQMLNPPLMGGFSFLYIKYVPFLYWMRLARAAQPSRTAAAATGAFVHWDVWRCRALFAHRTNHTCVWARQKTVLAARLVLGSLPCATGRLSGCSATGWARRRGRTAARAPHMEEIWRAKPALAQGVGGA